MHKKPLIAFTLLLALFAGLPAQAQSTPAKTALVERILKIQQPIIEGTGRALAERPAMEMAGRASSALESRVPADKRAAVAKDIQGDVKKYMDEAVPFVRDRAVKLAPQTIGVLLEQKFSEDELKQVIAFLESPAFIKYQQLSGDMEKSLLDKLLADTRATVEPKIVALDKSVAKRLGITAPPAK